jgi:hypothetical protein
VKARIVLSTLIVVTLGSLLHFAWEWSGRNSVVAIFAAMNESTWEHLKLAFWPALLLAPFQKFLYGTQPGWLPGIALRCLLSPLMIVLLFYGYTSLAGTNYLAADIATFIVAVFVAEVVGHAAMLKPAGKVLRAASALVLVLGVLAFSTLSFHPPAWFLFDDPLNHSLLSPLLPGYVGLAGQCCRATRPTFRPG